MEKIIRGNYAFEWHSAPEGNFYKIWRNNKFLFDICYSIIDCVERWILLKKVNAEQTDEAELQRIGEIIESYEM